MWLKDSAEGLWTHVPLSWRHQCVLLQHCNWINKHMLHQRPFTIKRVKPTRNWHCVNVPAIILEDHAAQVLQTNTRQDSCWRLQRLGFPAIVRHLQLDHIRSYFILFHPISKMFHNVSPSFSRDTVVWSQFGRAWNGARRLPRCCGFLLSKLAIKSGQSEALHHEFTAFPQKRFEHIQTLRRQPYRHTINIHRLHACDSF